VFEQQKLERIFERTDDVCAFAVVDILQGRR
jgi:hypothetical protein